MNEEKYKKSSAWKIWALGCVGLLALSILVFFGFRYFFSFRLYSTDEIHTQAVSPDRKYTATSFTRHGGATVTGESTTWVIVRDASSHLVYDETEIVLNRGAYLDQDDDVVFGTLDETDTPDAIPQPKWISNNRLLISNTGPLADTFRKLPDWNGVMVTYSKD